MENIQERNEEIKEIVGDPIPEDVLLWLCFNDLRLKDLPEIRSTMLSALNEPLASCRDIIEAFLLATTEILANLVQHPISQPSYIGVSLYTEISDDCRILVLNISDNAESFDGFQNECLLSTSKIDSGELEGTGGRGLGLIKMMMDSFVYQDKNDSEDELNHIILKRKIENVEKEENILSDEKCVNNFKEHTVFIVDDDRILRKLLNKILSDYYNVHVFSSALDALEAFEGVNPDLILSDLLMPEMNGAEFREALSKKENGDITPFVFLSGHAEEAGKSYINRLGIDGFLSKSIKKEDLLLTLSRVLHRSKQIKNDIKEHIDKKITNSLNPKIPKNIKNWSFEVRNDIADVGGGDFVLHHETNEGIVVVLADVMGHGLPAKFFSYAYVGYLRSLMRLSVEDCFNPAMLLQKLSKNVYEDNFLDDCIFTCQVLYLKNDGKLEISSAGHPWPILSTKKTVEFVKVSGPLPGMMPSMQYSHVNYQMNKGDRLFLYTDGVIENVEKSDLEKGQDTFLATINSCLDIDEIEVAIDMVWKTQIECFDSNIADDSTLLAIEYNNQQ